MSALTSPRCGVLWRLDDVARSRTSLNRLPCRHGAHRTRARALRRRDALLLTAGVGSAICCPGADAVTLRQFDVPWGSYGTLQPDKVTIPRCVHKDQTVLKKNVHLTFAVLLMRATYECVDALDFIAMDQFQVTFWKTRQSEFEPYKLMMNPLAVPIGNLSSPAYFDFISFSQYATISKAIPEAPQVFKEFCEDCDGDALDRPYRIVRRDPALADNTRLPERVQLGTGRLIYDNLRSGFRGETFACPAPLAAGTTDVSVVAEKVQDILDLFVSNGFAIKSKISAMQQRGSTMTWTISTEAPANLWSLQMLQFRRALVANPYEAFAVQAFLRASGFDSSYRLNIRQSSVEHSWVVTPL